MKVQIKVKDVRFVNYIEVCLQFIGSGSYKLENNTFTMNVNPLHANMLNDFIMGVMKREGYIPTEIYDYITNF